MKKLIVCSLMILVVAAAWRAWSQVPLPVYSTPVGSNYTVSATATNMIATNCDTLVSRTICWTGSGTIFVLESNTLFNVTTNTMTSAIITSPVIRATSGPIAVSAGECYQSSPAFGLFRGMVLIYGNGNTGIATLNEGKTQGGF